MLHFVFKSVGNYSVSFTQFAPAFAVGFIAILLKDKRILYEIKNRLYLQGSSVKWLIPSIIIPVLCIVDSSLVMSTLNITYVSWDGNVLFYILNIAAMLIGCCAEEIGWRGFLLPHLQKKHSPFSSSIIVGILWGAWHLNFTGGLFGFILYTITIIEMSVLMTWLFNRTKGNLFLMTMWHFMFNLSSHIFLWERFSIYLFIVESIVFGVACLIIVIASRKDFFN
jgi:membrane protease YdiL (CAAX protease family)